MDDFDISKSLPPYPNVCPLCQSVLKYIYINFKEKLFTCVNEVCEYPYGYGELQFVEVDDEDSCDEEGTSIKSVTSQESLSTYGSIVSAVAWSEIDKLNKIYDSEDSQFETKTPDVREYFVRQDKGEEKSNVHDDILENVKAMKKMNIELCDDSEKQTEKYPIKNEKWIKVMMTLEEMSRARVKMLKSEEVNLLKKDVALGNNELKINIDTGNDSSMSSIKIEIDHKI